MILDVNNVCGLIDNNLAEFIHTIVVILKFGVPILLIIFGMLDLGRGVVANNEDEIRKGRLMFIKRLVAAVIVFFVVTIVQLLIGVVDDTFYGQSNVWNCAKLILNGR